MTRANRSQLSGLDWVGVVRGKQWCRAYGWDLLGFADFGWANIGGVRPQAERSELDSFNTRFRAFLLFNETKNIAVSLFE